MPAVETGLVVAFGLAVVAGLYLAGRAFGKRDATSRPLAVLTVAALSALSGLLAALGGDDDPPVSTSFRLKIFFGVFAFFFVPLLVGLIRGIRASGLLPFRRDA